MTVSSQDASALSHWKWVRPSAACGLPLAHKVASAAIARIDDVGQSQATLGAFSTVPEYVSPPRICRHQKAELEVAVEFRHLARGRFMDFPGQPRQSCRYFNDTKTPARGAAEVSTDHSRLEGQASKQTRFLRSLDPVT